MKTRDFDINNYAIIDYHICRLNELYSTIEYLGYMITKKFSRLDIPKELRELEISDYSIEEQQKINEFFFTKYTEKKEKTIKDFNAIKKEADFIFEDDKKYKLLMKTIEDSYYCQATTFIKDYINKVCDSKAAQNLRFKVRRQQYNSNITCD